MLKSFLSLFVLALSGCSVMVPNVRMCSTSYMAAGAECAETLTDNTQLLTLDEWIEFLEVRPEQKLPDGKILPAKGPAMCLSSADFTKLKNALDQACLKLGRWCSKEIKEQAEKAAVRAEGLKQRAIEKRKKKPTKGGV